MPARIITSGPSPRQRGSDLPPPPRRARPIPIRGDADLPPVARRPPPPEPFPLPARRAPAPPPDANNGAFNKGGAVRKMNGNGNGNGADRMDAMEKSRLMGVMNGLSRAEREKVLSKIESKYGADVTATADRTDMKPGWRRHGW
jgi:hypothetical protein